MHVREAVVGDAGRLVALMRTLYSETTFMLLEPDEFTVTEEEQARRMEERARSGSGVMFVAESDDRLIGVVFGTRGFARRNCHSLYIVIGVLQAWVGRGIGRSL